LLPQNTEQALEECTRGNANISRHRSMDFLPRVRCDQPCDRKIESTAAATGSSKRVVYSFDKVLLPLSRCCYIYIYIFFSFLFRFFLTTTRYICFTGRWSRNQSVQPARTEEQVHKGPRVRGREGEEKKVFFPVILKKDGAKLAAAPVIPALRIPTSRIATRIGDNQIALRSN
jgi:hypothetical protein